MIKTENLTNGYVRIYSDEGKHIQKGNEKYIECVVRNPKLEEYVEIE